MNTITQQYIGELQANPHVLGIILFGSLARGNNRADSDVDLLVIVRHGFKRTVEYRAGQAFEITYTTEHGVIVYWQSNLDDTFEFWSTAKVLFDRDGTVARLQHAAQAIQAHGKPPLTTDQYEHFKFDAYDQVKAVEALAHTDPATARMLLSAKVFQLTELFFDLRQVWTPPPKQRLSVIKRINDHLCSLIVRYYDEPSLVEQIRIVKSIIPIVFDT